jgi:hypothetical protein
MVNFVAVERIVFAWKKDHKLDASICLVRTSVWYALLIVSLMANSKAKIEINSAIFLLLGST